MSLAQALGVSSYRVKWIRSKQKVLLFFMKCGKKLKMIKPINQC